MSFSLGAILIAGDYGNRRDILLRRLGLLGYIRQGSITLNEASKRGFAGTAIGTYKGSTIVIDHLLPYDCSYNEKELHSLDERLMQLSLEGAVFSFFIDGGSGTFGFCWYEGGARIRYRQADLVETYVDVGPPLANEAVAEGQGYDEESRIFAITQELLGEPLDTLIFGQDVWMTVYARET